MHCKENQDHIYWTDDHRAKAGHHNSLTCGKGRSKVTIKKQRGSDLLNSTHVYYQICVSIVTWVYAWDSQDASLACVHGVMAHFSFQRPLKQIRG